jgi:hypothetical protein
MHSIASSTAKHHMSQPSVNMVAPSGQKIRDMPARLSGELEPASELQEGMASSGQHQRYGSGVGGLVRSASSQHRVNTGLLTQPVN